MTRCAMFDSKMLQLARLATPLDSHHACALQPSGEVQRAAAVQRFGIILGTLGRQGNPAILNRLEAKLKAAGKQYFVLLLSEIFPKKVQHTARATHTGRFTTSHARCRLTHSLACYTCRVPFCLQLASFTEIDAWIQIACPRLSIDWGTEFAKVHFAPHTANRDASSLTPALPHIPQPLLNPFEAEVALQAQAWPTQVSRVFLGCCTIHVALSSHPCYVYVCSIRWASTPAARAPGATTTRLQRR